jgi:receptor protein-tyrosine kinase
VANSEVASGSHDAAAKARSKVRQSEPSSATYGQIDLARLRKAGMITPDGEKTQISEEFRVIKRPLLTNVFSRSATRIKNGNLIMVTSSFPGEGKSFSAINLAMSIAMEKDHTVLLVDADVAKPSIPASLGLAPSKGLMDLLLDESLRFSDVLIKTNVDKLTILPAGRWDAHATELLASERMNRLLEELAQRYDDRIVIFDSPPLLVTTESRTLASKMGQIVMVVEAAKTPQTAVKEALSQIEKCEVVGLILNKSAGLLGDDATTYGAYGGYGS